MYRSARKTMIKAVFFDLDNTLIDFMKMKEASVNAAVEEMIHGGLNLDKKTAIREIYEIYNKEGIEDDRIFQKFLMKTNREIDHKILAAAIVNYRKAQTGFIKTYPKVTHVLVEMHRMGIQVGMITDAPEIKAWIRLTEMHIQDFFDVVVANKEESELKPSKEPFLRALKQLDLKAEDCLMVGDSPEKDIEGAKRVGMKTALAKYGANTDADCKAADYVLNGIEDLLPILKGLCKPEQKQL